MSLSRRYRPQQFSDITGQESVKETLRREVATGKIGHAYLFFGPRGVGKTTSARIFAKALNCLNPKDGEPCNACDRCNEANQGRAIDLIEMDAASHTGVDNIREGIVEHVRFAPSIGKYKVYILDEAHMLSTSAWNAMLKTLEEPPEHGIFILATTEFHKVPMTIISRCQRFEFTRLGREDIQSRIEMLAEKEGTTLDKTVVQRIAKHAEGSIRDAETLLGQLVALGEKEISEDVAGLLLPVSRLPLAVDFLRITSTRSLKDTMNFVTKIDEQGVQVIPFFHDVIEAVRHLLIASDDQNYQTRLKEGDEGEKAVSELVGVYSAAELRDIALLCMDRRKDAKQGIDPRFALELTGATIALGLLQNSPKGVTQPKPITASAPVIHKPEAVPVEEPTVVPIAEEVVEESKKEIEEQKPSGPAISLSDVQREWSSFMQKVNEEMPSMSFILKTSHVDSVKDNTVFIRLSYSFHKKKLIENLETKKKLEVILRKVLNSDVLLDAIVSSGTEGSGDGEKPANKDVVSSLIQNFGGQVVE